MIQEDNFKQLYLQEKKIHQIISSLSQAEHLNEIFLDIKDSLIELFDCERVTIYAIDKKKRQLYSRVRTGQEPMEIRLNLDNKSIAGFIALHKCMLNIKNVYDPQELSKYPGLNFDASWDQKTGFKTRSVLAAPLILKNKFLIGVIQLLNKKNGWFEQQDEQIIHKMAPTLAGAFYHLLRFQQRFGKFEFLIESYKLSYTELDLAIKKARQGKNCLEKDVCWVLLHDFGISKKEIGESLSRYYQTEFIAYSPSVHLPQEFLDNLNINYLRTKFWVPYKRQDGQLLVLIDDPFDEDKKKEVYFSILNEHIKFCVSLREDILKFLDDFEKKKTSNLSSLEDVLDELEESQKENQKEQDELETSILSEDAPAIIRLVNKVIKEAYEQKVSDIHVEPGLDKEPADIRFRKDGVCFLYASIPSSHVRAFINRIKIMSSLNIAEKRLPQSGKIKLKYHHETIELRVEVTPTVGGKEDIVMRILAAGKPLPLEKMNFTRRNLKALEEIIQKPYGIFLVVGPTGSGKTTTLHSILGRLNTPDKKIWTAEDPVEITQKGLRQVQVSPKIGYTFATAMRSFLRADPDIIMVGEMRDKETAHIGIEASLTGHLVLSTLHTNSAPETITRLIDMGMNPFNFADALLGILAQRLVRTLCPHCKQSYHPSKEEFDLLVSEYGKKMFSELNITYNENLTLYRPKGCAQCNQSGYKGRTALHELLTATPQIKQAIVKGSPVKEILQIALSQGMRTLKQDGIIKVFQGQTDLLSVRRVCI